MVAGFVAGVRHVTRGFRLLGAPGIRRFVVVPLLINLLLFGVALSSLDSAFARLVAPYLADWPAWIYGLAWALFALLAAVLVFCTFSVFANVVASPFTGPLAAAVERHLRGAAVTPAGAAPPFLGEALRAVAAELRKAVYIGVRALPLLLLTIIPGINAAAPLLWLLFGAWMLALEYLDYPFGNHGQVFPAVVAALRQERGMALGFGIGMLAVTLTPVVNFLAVPVGVAAATSLYCAHFADGGPA